jgi:hypothetical protein
MCLLLKRGYCARGFFCQSHYVIRNIADIVHINVMMRMSGFYEDHGNLYNGPCSRPHDVVRLWALDIRSLWDGGGGGFNLISDGNVRWCYRRLDQSNVVDFDILSYHGFGGGVININSIHPKSLVMGTSWPYRSKGTTPYMKLSVHWKRTSRSLLYHTVPERSSTLCQRESQTKGTAPAQITSWYYLWYQQRAYNEIASLAVCCSYLWAAPYQLYSTLVKCFVWNRISPSIYFLHYSYAIFNIFYKLTSHPF